MNKRELIKLMEQEENLAIQKHRQEADVLINNCKNKFYKSMELDLLADSVKTKLIKILREIEDFADRKKIALQGSYASLHRGLKEYTQSTDAVMDHMEMYDFKIDNPELNAVLQQVDSDRKKIRQTYQVVKKQMELLPNAKAIKAYLIELGYPESMFSVESQAQTALSVPVDTNYLYIPNKENSQ